MSSLTIKSKFNINKKLNIHYLYFLKELFKIFPVIFYYVLNWECFIKIKKIYVNQLMFFFKYHSNLLFQQLIDISALDYIEKRVRYELFYNLLSIVYNNRICITLSLFETDSLSSIINIFKSANWYEREIWDMYGVFFKEHFDLRRMLTDYGFRGHPLRKDFPLTGYIEVRYDDFLKRIVYEDVSLAQEYRIFILENNWSDVNKIYLK